MLSDSYAANYFANHIMAEKLADFSTTEKHNAVRIANIDIKAAIGKEVVDDDDDILTAAVCEQAIRLLLFRNNFFENSGRELASEKIEGLGSKSYFKSSTRTVGLLSERAKELIDAFLSGNITLKRG